MRSALLFPALTLTLFVGATAFGAAVEVPANQVTVVPVTDATVTKCGPRFQNETANAAAAKIGADTHACVTVVPVHISISNQDLRGDNTQLDGLITIPATINLAKHPNGEETVKTAAVKKISDYVSWAVACNNQPVRIEQNERFGQIVVTLPQEHSWASLRCSANPYFESAKVQASKVQEQAGKAYAEAAKQSAELANKASELSKRAQQQAADSLRDFANRLNTEDKK